MRLQGKMALVTGSGPGIGRAIAVRFAREGAEVAINYAHEAGEAEETRREVEFLGRKAVVIRADLGSVAEARRMIDEAVRGLGRLDILVNNAGVEVDAPFVETTEEDYDKVFDVNLKGLFFASQAFARHLIDTERPGKIIQISSVHEDIPFPGYASYCASKGGVRMLTRDLAVGLGPLGINVNGIAPGAIETEINSAMLKDKTKVDALIGRIPLGRLGKPEDVAGIAAFLASSDADYVTGSTYFVDGGLTRNYRE